MNADGNMINAVVAMGYSSVTVGNTSFAQYYFGNLVSAAPHINTITARTNRSHNAQDPDSDKVHSPFILYFHHFSNKLVVRPLFRLIIFITFHFLIP